MVIVGGQIYDDIVPFIVSVDGMETEVRVGLVAEYMQISWSSTLL